MTARLLPGVLFAGDRELITHWDTSGIPRGRDGNYDPSTVEACARLCVRLLDGLDAAWDVIDSLTHREAS